MSMFRRPGEDSSTEESSDEHEEHDEKDRVSQDENLLSRINTLDQASARHSGLQSPTSRPTLSRHNSQFRDLILHSLLEEKALTEAAQHLGKDKSDPEVQELGRTTYQALSRQISDNIDHRYASDDMRPHRATAQEKIGAATRSHLTGLPMAGNMAGASQALIARTRKGMEIEVPPVASSGLDALFSIPPSIQLPLQGYPGLHTDRYIREFVELDVVGKGGYGKVFKVQHKLDNSFYAVKRIMVSPARLQKIQEHGPQEMESMLDEVRSLARFDHGNIVRYHNAWLEFTSELADVPLPPTANLLRRDRLLEGASEHSFNGTDGLNSRFDSWSFGDPFANEDGGAGIVFESSDNGARAEEPKNDSDFSSFRDQERTPRRKRRRGSQASQATIATISSTKSHMSMIEDANEEEEEDIETIPRTHLPLSQETSDISESMMSHSDIPSHLISTRTTGPVLTLNVQMSLYDTNLAAFLSSEQQSFSANPHLHHCFHPCISLELLSNIISGVEYLHAQGVVHRDLKPANVFLSLTTSRIPPSGSVDLASCKPCPARECAHITPRIGDFGLVAALGDKCMAKDGVVKPVGTEFYRPEGGEEVSEKLDVFALGVLGFEMLQRFGTRMERIQALTQLRHGEFPQTFAEAVGGGHGNKVQELISGMVKAEANARLSCEDAKRELGEVINILKT